MAVVADGEEIEADKPSQHGGWRKVVQEVSVFFIITHSVIEFVKQNFKYKS